MASDLVFYQFSRLKVERMDFGHFLSLYALDKLPVGGRLRRMMNCFIAWFTTEAGRYEHAWAKAAARLPGVVMPMPGFGSSDCACETHLFCFGAKTLVRAIRQRVKTTVSIMRATSAGPTSKRMVGSLIA